MIQNMGNSKSNSKREVYSSTILPQEKRKISNKKANFTPKATGYRETNKPKVSRRKENIHIRAETKKAETEQKLRSMKLKADSLRS